MLYYVKEEYTWEPGKTVLLTAIEPILFLSKCLTKPELYYRPSKLEVICFVWACKRLWTTLHSNCYKGRKIITLTDYKVMKGIVNKI